MTCESDQAGSFEFFTLLAVTKANTALGAFKRKNRIFMFLIELINHCGRATSTDFHEAIAQRLKGLSMTVISFWKAYDFNFNLYILPWRALSPFLATYIPRDLGS